MATQDSTKIERKIGPYHVATRDVGHMVAFDWLRHRASLTEQHTETFFLADGDLDEVIALLVETRDQRKALKEGETEGWAARLNKRLKEIEARVKAKHSAPIPDVLAGAPPDGRNVIRMPLNDQHLVAVIGPSDGYRNGMGGAA